MRTIYDRLSEYSRSEYYGFHMPGHKRMLNMLGTEPAYAIDITEIDGFDDLHHADGILKSAQERAAKVYHGDETHFLINGSSVGILSAVAGVTRRGDTILVARNCHKSVYHAIEMNGLSPVYLTPGVHASVQMNTEVSAKDVRAALEENPEIKAAVIVSPTYDGVVSDVEAISEAVHEKGIPVIVDEAHGAHFGFHPYFPENSNKKGADIVIHSLHKTLPSLTQTALLHMNGNLVRRERVRRYLHMLQSSSPSYVLMASIDSCVDLLENRRKELFVPYVKNLQKLRARLLKLRRLKLVQTDRYDFSKLVISAGETGLTGRQLSRILLEKYQLQMEMAAGRYVLAMTSVGDTPEGFCRLASALEEIDGGRWTESLPSVLSASVWEIRGGISGCTDGDGRSEEMSGSFEERGNNPCLPKPDVVYNSSDMEEMLDRIREYKPDEADAFQTEDRTTEAGLVRNADGADGPQAAEKHENVTGTEFRLWKDSVGCVSAEYAYLYPPGSPLIVPGEKVSQEAADVLQWYYEMGFSIEGLKRDSYIEVLTHG